MVLRINVCGALADACGLDERSRSTRMKVARTCDIRNQWEPSRSLGLHVLVL